MHRILLSILLTTTLFAKDIIAILELEQKGLTKQEAEILTDRLITKLISIDKYQVVERTNMDKILKEQKFQHSGCTDSECAVEIGQLLNADFIVIGSVSKFGSTYALDSRLIDVGQGTSLISAEFSMKGEIDVLLTTGMTSIAQQLCGLENTPQYTETSDFVNMKSIKELENQLEVLEEEKRAAGLKADAIRLQNLEEKRESSFEEFAEGKLTAETDPFKKIKLASSVENFKTKEEEYREKLKTHTKILKDGKNIWVPKDRLDGKPTQLLLIGDILEEKNGSGNTVLSGEVKNVGDKRADFAKIIFKFHINWKGETKTIKTLISGTTHTFDTGISSNNSILPHAVGNFEMEISKSFGSFIGYSWDIEWSEYND